MYQFVIVIDIAGMVVGIFGVHFDSPTVEELILPRRLHKHISIPQPFAPPPHIVHNRPRYTPLGIVVIALNLPETRGRIVVVQPCLHPHGIYIAVLPHRRSIVRQLARGGHTPIAELVFTIRVHHLCIHREAELFR